MKASISSDYRAVRDGGAGLIDLSSRGRILVSGSEALMFLNGLITNDMKTLALNSWMPAAFANVQGRLLAVVRMLHREEGFLMDTESATHETILKLLERFTFAGDFRVTDLTSETAMFSVQGREAPDVISAATNRDAAKLERQTVVTTRLESGGAVTILRTTHTGEDGFDLLVEASHTQQLRNDLIKAGAQSVSDEVGETLRIEAGIPRYGIDMDETTVVTETNLDDAVSFTKGCYIGQEIIVRIQHRGHVAKKLTGVILDGQRAIATDAKILSGEEKEIGRVTSSTFSPRLDRTVALGYVKYDYLVPGTKVTISAGDSAIGGEVADLPFVRGSWYADESEQTSI